VSNAQVSRTPAAQLEREPTELQRYEASTDAVLAEVDGTVSRVSVAVGDVIQAGDLIAVIS